MPAANEHFSPTNVFALLLQVDIQFGVKAQSFLMPSMRLDVGIANAIDNQYT